MVSTLGDSCSSHEASKEQRIGEKGQHTFGPRAYTGTGRGSCKVSEPLSEPVEKGRGGGGGRGGVRFPAVCSTQAQIEERALLCHQVLPSHSTAVAQPNTAEQYKNSQHC